MSSYGHTLLVGQVVEEELRFSLDELSCACAVTRERIVELVEHGVLDAGAGEAAGFGGLSLRRARLALRLQEDLGVNAAGAALAVELLERIALLEAQLRERVDAQGGLP